MWALVGAFYSCLLCPLHGRPRVTESRGGVAVIWRGGRFTLFPAGVRVVVHPEQVRTILVFYI